MTEMSVRQWQERFRAGDFSSKDRAVRCEAGWYDWFCQDVALAGRLQKLSKVVMGITDPYILDHYYVWFKNNCPLSGPLYDDIRFEPLHGDRSGKYFVVIRDSPHEAHKWTLYTERHGFEQPEFTCGNVRDSPRVVERGAGPEAGGRGARLRRLGLARQVNAMFAQKENKLLTRNVRLGLDTYKHRRSLNVLVIGSGAAKTRSYVKPNILEANTSYVVTDPKQRCSPP